MNLERIRELEALPDEVAEARIRELRAQQGKDVVLLAHLYQRKRIADLADFTGDSFSLSRSAAHADGKYIVFCGVRFMAESAAILARPEQKVIHPDPEAGCPMADMASLDEVHAAWKAITLGSGGKVIPVTYMNSTADIKAFCGERDGVICTSSNATKTFEWAFSKGERIFFLPDEHLGRNTALKYGISPDDITVWDPEKPDGYDPEAKVVLWRGYCPVHQKFTVRDVEHVRRFYPKAKVLVHPECPNEVVRVADYVGSTDGIRKWVASETKAGDEVFIGTEINLVQNLASEYPDRLIAKLHRSLCLTMYQITLGKLLYALENIDELPAVEVPDSVIKYSRLALDRMLALPQ